MAVNAKKVVRSAPSKGTLAYEYKHLGYEPLMLQFLMLLEASGKTPSFVAHATGVSENTLSNWKKKKTKRPNSSTLRFAYRALGYKLGPIKEG